VNGCVATGPINEEDKATREKEAKEEATAIFTSIHEHITGIIREETERGSASASGYTSPYHHQFSSLLSLANDGMMITLRGDGNDLEQKGQSPAFSFLSPETASVDDMMKKILLQRGEGRLYEFAQQLQLPPEVVVEEMEKFLAK
jgi:hypothetical protein